MWYCPLCAVLSGLFRDPKGALLRFRSLVAPARRVTRVSSLETAAPTVRRDQYFLSRWTYTSSSGRLPERSLMYRTQGEVSYCQMKGSMVNAEAITMKEAVTNRLQAIAGILARRIVCWKHKGEVVALGERFGLIKFSSRTDVILPESVKVLVAPGMHVKGGTTIIGRLR